MVGFSKMEVLLGLKQSEIVEIDQMMGVVVGSEKSIFRLGH